MAQGSISVGIVRTLRASRILAIAKNTSGIRPIAIGEVFLRLISHILVLQLRIPFQEYIFTHQFGVAMSRGYEFVSLGIRALLDLNLD